MDSMGLHCTGPLTYIGFFQLTYAVQNCIVQRSTGGWKSHVQRTDLSYMHIFDCVGVSAPNLHIVQRSIVLPSNRIVGQNDDLDQCWV